LNTTSADASSANENHFIKVFIIVLAALTAFTIFCVMVARLLAPMPDPNEDSLLRAALLDRISPVGSVNTSADDIQAVAVVAAAPSAPRSGEEVVNSVCAACHNAGIAGAPKSDDDAAWAQRRELGLDALVASVVNGKGAMPARGGAANITDDEIRAAVIHMAGFEAEEPAEAATQESAAAETEEATAEQTEEVAAESTEDATDTTGAVAATAVAAASDIMITDRVKGAVDGVCAACHIAGIGGAPKFGDTAAWEARAEVGLEALAAVVAAGKGAMPARGGSDLTDEELIAAVEYMMSK